VNENAEPSSRSSIPSRGLVPRDAFFLCCAATLVVAVGVLGLVDDAWLRRAIESWVNIHALFGQLLGGLVLARFYTYSKRTDVRAPADIREFSRQMTRMVYLILYVVIGARQIISLWHGGIVDLNLFDKHFRHAPDRHGFDLKNDFQALFVCGLCVLALVRVVAFRMWLRSVDQRTDRSNV
jgi:hypothetical protein